MNGSCSNDFLWDVGVEGRGNRCLGAQACNSF